MYSLPESICRRSIFAAFKIRGSIQLLVTLLGHCSSTIPSKSCFSKVRVKGINRMIRSHVGEIERLSSQSLSFTIVRTFTTYFEKFLPCPQKGSAWRDLLFIKMFCLDLPEKRHILKKDNSEVIALQISTTMKLFLRYHFQLSRQKL